MNVITLTEKPESGRRYRECKVCGEIYWGWNFIACHVCEHEHNYIVVENWSK
jgi:hypothetical protein